MVKKVKFEVFWDSQGSLQMVILDIKEYNCSMSTPARAMQARQEVFELQGALLRGQDKKIKKVLQSQSLQQRSTTVFEKVNHLVGQ